jgi:hypothetical protein
LNKFIKYDFLVKINLNRCYMTNIIRTILAMMIFSLLSACGGGGGSAGSTKVGVALFTTAAEKITISPGETHTYNVGGGVPGYAATSSSSAASASINGSQLTIKGNGGGSAVITVTDSAGAKIKIETTVGSGIDFYTTAPSAVTVGVGVSSAIYSMGGGSQVYSVSSSDINIATVGQMGREFVITGRAGGKAVIVAKDTLGKEVKIDVVVGTADSLFSTAASSINIAVGAANSYKVGGGTTVYNVGSSNLSIATAVINGNDLIITGVAAGKATIIVRDTTSGSLSIDVTVGTGDVIPLFTTAGSDIVVAPNAIPSYKISGGRAPYSVSSSNTNVATANVSGNTLNIVGVIAGSAKILVKDALGITITINIVVGTGAPVSLFTTAPATLTLGIADIASYTISGGTAPYTVTSNNPNVVTVSLLGETFNITGVKAGAAQVSVKDSIGGVVQVAVTISATASITLEVLPGDVTGSVGDTLNFKLSGGSPSFTVTNNNPSIATVTPTTLGDGGIFTAKLLNVGSTDVSVVDAQGQVKKIKITATAASSLLRLSPSSFTVGEDYSNVIALSIFGGTGPYIALTSDLVISSATISGSTLNVGLGSQSSRCIRPIDASGTFQIGGTYLVTLTVIDNFGASATSTMTIKDNSKGGAGCL